LPDRNAFPWSEVRSLMATKKEKVIALEKDFWEKSDSPEFFKEAFADEGLTIMEPYGFIEKDAAVEMSGQSKPFKKVKMHDVEVRELTPDCIAIAYHGEGQREGEKEPYRASISSVYVHRKDKWQLALTTHQPWSPEAKK